jgi:hypothetical protein
VALAASLLITAEAVAINVWRELVRFGSAARLALVIGSVQYAGAVLAADVPASFR